MEREKITKIKLFVNNDEKSKEVAKILEDELIRNDFCLLDADYELAISIGGDGSFLRMVQETNFKNDVYYIGVNSGTLGFLQEIDINDTKNFTRRLKENDYKEEEINILKTTIYTKEREYVFYSLNEIVIRKSDFRILKSQVYIDNELLENFTGDGLLISTSTGSTAYNMSFGGSIIYNTLDAYILTPIAPINNKAYNTLTNSIVIPQKKSIHLQNIDTDLFCMIDGRNYYLNDVIKIESKIDSKTIKCLRMNDFHFIKVVKQKIIEK